MPGLGSEQLTGNSEQWKSRGEKSPADKSWGLMPGRGLAVSGAGFRAITSKIPVDGESYKPGVGD